MVAGLACPLTAATPSVIPDRAFVFTNAKTEDCLRKQTIWETFYSESRHAWPTSGYGTRTFSYQSIVVTGISFLWI